MGLLILFLSCRALTVGQFPPRLPQHQISDSTRDDETHVHMDKWVGREQETVHA